MSLLIEPHTSESLFLNKSCFLSSSSTLFEHDCDALAAADAGRPDAQPLLVLPELVDEVAADARAGGGERVTDGDGAAARVELWGGRYSVRSGVSNYG